MSQVIDLLDVKLTERGVATLSIRTRAARLMPGYVDGDSPRIMALDWRGRVVPLRAEELAQLERRHLLS